MGLRNSMWWTTFVGPKQSMVTEESTTRAVFDMLWSECSEVIVTTTNAREEQKITLKDLNLYLASLLTIGLNSQPTIRDYFSSDNQGLNGNLWMQQHFTEESWTFLNAHTHYEYSDLIEKVKNNGQKLWDVNRQLVVDEMIVPFTGRWKHRQHVKGKPHSTGGFVVY